MSRAHDGLDGQCIGLRIGAREDSLRATIVQERDEWSALLGKSRVLHVREALGARHLGRRQHHRVAQPARVVDHREVLVDPRLERGERIPCARDRGGDRRVHPSAVDPVHLEHEFVLRREVPVERARREPGGAQDVVHGRLLRSVPLDQLVRRPHDLLLLGAVLLLTRRRNPAGRRRAHGGGLGAHRPRIRERRFQIAVRR